MISFTIPLQPISKKNSQQIMVNRTTGKPFIMPSKAYKQYEAAAMLIVPAVKEPIDYPVNVKCLFYMKTHRKVDKSNLEEAIHDIIVKAGLLADDNRDIIASTDGSRVYYSKENPRTEVYITPFDEDYEQWGKK